MLRPTTASTIFAAALMASATTLAAPAHADDSMYRVGTDIMPGDYTYTVNDSDWGAWKLCGDANCSDILSMDVIDGYGHSGYLTVTASARYVRLTNLALVPA